MVDKTNLEIDYLKHLQEHNMFNYNLKHNEYLAGVAIVIAMFIGIFSFIENFLNVFGIMFSAIVYILLTIILVLIVSLFYEKSKNEVCPETQGFRKYHFKIQSKYKKLGLDIEELGR